jgi:hypothetical protein
MNNLLYGDAMADARRRDLLAEAERHRLVRAARRSAGRGETSPPRHRRMLRVAARLVWRSA